MAIAETVGMTHETETLLDIAQLARAARSAQKAYFLTRTRDALIASKELERQLDERLKALSEIEEAH